jgi:hypothetical protein
VQTDPPSIAAASWGGEPCGKMVKRVAFVLCRESGFDPICDYNGRHGWERYIKLAREAVAAMHEPTDEMIIAIDQALENSRVRVEHRGSDTVAGAVETYKAMIQAALGEA